MKNKEFKIVVKNKVSEESLKYQYCSLDNLPVVAVIMSVCYRDSAELLCKAIDSIIGQNYPEEKIRIYFGIDGKIPENLNTVIDRYKKAIYKIVKIDKNSGLSVIMNRLIQCLQDELYVFRMDSDDFSLPNRFFEQVLFLESNFEIDILGTGIVEVDVNGNELLEKNYPCSLDSIKKFICKGSPLAHPTVCFRKTVFDIIEGYPENLRFSQDISLWFKALNLNVKISNLQKPLYRMTINDSFFKRRGLQKAQGEFFIYLKGVWGMHGISPKLIYPFLRLLFRLMPAQIVKLGYQSILRKRFLSG